MNFYNYILLSIIGVVLALYIQVQFFGASAPSLLQTIQDEEINAIKNENVERNYQIPNFIFITPWNKEGYARTLKYSKKLDMVSPAWFTVRFNNVIDGIQDVNEEWMKQIKINNPNILIIPRIFIELEQKTLLQQVNDPSLVDSIFKVIKNYSFDGIMIDTPYISFIDTLDAHDILKFLKQLKSKFIKMNAQFKFVLSLYGYYTPQQYQHSTLKKIFQLADYTLIQTYDYQIQDQEYQLLSPYEWLQENLQYFMHFQQKILFGIPFYGFKKSDQNINHIIGREIMELDPQNYITEWDRTNSECYYKNEQTIISYPCPKFVKYRLDLIQEFQRGFFIWEGGQGLEQHYQIF